MFRYNAAVDDGDFDTAGALFADGVFRTRGVEAHGATEVTAILRRHCIIYDDGTPGTAHVVSNVQIEVAPGAVTATSMSYFMVLQGGAAGSGVSIIDSGRYHDVFARVDADWRFASRFAENRLIGDRSRHLRDLPQET
jgi:SnoaL-like domain